MIRPMPNGQGAAQQTTAAQMVLGRVANGGTPSGRRRSVRTSSRKAQVRRTRAPASRRSKRPARLVKGSAAAKKYMASIRRKRRR